MLKDIVNNAEIDVIWDSYQEKLEPLRARLNEVIGEQWAVIGKGKKPFKPLEEWEIPRERPANWPPSTADLLAQWWEQRLARQQEIDASIAAKADQEYLYDKPYEDRSTVRVAGPFTVESLSPHRILVVDENDDLVQQGTYGSGENFIAERGDGYHGGVAETADFATIILENLKTAGVQQAHKEDRISFTALTGWPGSYICAKGATRKKNRAKSGALASSSAPNLAPSPAPTWSPRPVKRAMPISTCSSPAPSTTTPTPPSSTNSAASPCSRPA
jgi:adenine-specific DNA-methyltransferase